MNTQKYNTFHDWILTNLPENSTMLEFGSGPGTKRFTEKYTVYSIEHNKEWLGHDPKSNYIYAPIKVNKSDGISWYNEDVLESSLKNLKYDLILVDGPLGSIGRSGLKTHLHLLNTDVPIVFDDVNRPAELKLMQDVCKLLNRTPTIFIGVNRKFSIL